MYKKHKVLKTVSISTLSGILNEASIKPHRIRYYLEKRDKDFEKKMEEVLIVYKKVQMKLEKKLQDEYIMVSYDEKPGIQAIGNTVVDEKYDKDKKILVILDNHSVHRSRKTNEYFETRK